MRYEHAPCGLLSTEPGGVIRRANATFCGWVGLPAGEIVGVRRFQDLLTVGGRIFHQTHFMPLLGIQGSIAEVQLDLRRADGEPVPVLVNARRFARDGATFDDIAVFVATDRKKYERELMAARRRAEELLESERQAQAALAAVLREQGEAARQRAELAEQLVGIASHDLRSPLNAIALGASLLSKTASDPQTLRVAERMASSARRANRLIDDLLDLTQARLGGGVRVNPGGIDLHEVVASTVEELRLAWPQRAIEHRIEGPGAARADGDRMSQVVTNLVQNALVYGAKDRPVVVTTRTRDGELGVEVHNEGAPIPDALVPHLFEPMRRGSPSAGSSRSVGLGLYIVHEIARAHGGEVAVRSTDAGTTFVLRAPG